MGKDMARHYLGILWGVCLLAPLAWADQVTSGELALEYQAPWQRAEETEERDEDSIVLRWTRGDSPFTLYLPRHRVRLNITEAQFHDQLERKWRAKYGSAAEISWRELGKR